jgi:hypothetical protein
VPTLHELPCVHVREQSVPFRAGIYHAEPHESLHRLGGNGSGISRSLQIKFGLILIGWIDGLSRARRRGVIYAQGPDSNALWDYAVRRGWEAGSGPQSSLLPLVLEGLSKARYRRERYVVCIPKPGHR